MSIEDTIGYKSEDEICVVCGKGLKAGEALAWMHPDAGRLPICCPLCLESYQANPEPHLERLAKRTLLREIDKVGEHPPE